MSRVPSSDKVLLLQIRDHPEVRAEELASFARYSGLKVDQIDVLNVFDEPEFSADVASGYAGLLVGGASEASVMEPERYRFVPACLELLAQCVRVSQPVFASCFGFQLAVVALGGKLVRDESGFEMGTPAISLTPVAGEDPLFHDTQSGFRAVSVHRERATELPEVADLLAFTAACPHAFRVKDKPFWAFQFHPEVDRSTLTDRLTIFKAQYTQGDEQLTAALSSITDTPESNALPQKFVQRVLML